MIILESFILEERRMKSYIDTGLLTPEFTRYIKKGNPK